MRRPDKLSDRLMVSQRVLQSFPSRRNRVEVQTGELSSYHVSPVPMARPLDSS